MFDEVGSLIVLLFLNQVKLKTTGLDCDSHARTVCPCSSMNSLLNWHSGRSVQDEADEDGRKLKINFNTAQS